MIDDIDKVGGFVLFAIGRNPVTLGAVIASVALLVGGILIARIAGAGIRRLRDRTRNGAAALYIVEKLITYGLVIVAFVASLSTLGLNLSSLAVFAGAVGVGLGLGLQGVVKEFVSGLVLIFDRVLNVGDYVELEDGKRGLVQEIGPRAVRVRTNDNIDVFIPNSRFIEGPVVNWTLRDHTRRIHIPFGVAYGSDRQKVRDVVLAAARSVSFTAPETDTQKCQVWLIGFGDSSLDFELLVWPTIEAVKRPAAMHAAYTWAIADALDEAGIEIPFPQRDVRVRSLFGQEGRSAIETLRLDTAAEEAAPKKPRRRSPGRGGTNDAAEDLARPLPSVDDPPDEPAPDKPES